MRSVVAFVLNNFKNDSRVLKENISLKKAGYDVQVVALHEEPLAERELIYGISVHRVKLRSRSWPKTLFFQIFKYIEFVIRSIKLSRKADIFHCNDLNTLPLGVFIKLFFNKNAKVIYDAHEYEIEANGLKGFEKYLSYAIEKILIRHADKVITVSGSIANEYVKIYGIQKPELILNCPYFSALPRHNRFREHLRIRHDQTIFLYQGNLAKGRGIELLIEVFSKMDSDDNVIVFMGNGPLEKLVIDVGKLHSNVFFHPAVSQNELLCYSASANFGVCFIEDSCLSYRYCLPNKLFEYLMAGIPVVTSKLIEVQLFVEHHGVGVVANENTADGLIDAINRSLKLDYELMMKKVCSIRELICWEAQEKALLDIYNKCY